MYTKICRPRCLKILETLIVVWRPYLVEEVRKNFKFRNMWKSYEAFLGPLSSTPPQFKTSVPHKRTTSFQPQKSLSSTHPSVPHRKPLGSTPKTPQFHTNTFCLRVCWTEGFLVWNKGLWGTEWSLVWNWVVFGVELRGFCVELRDFGVELRGFCWKGVVLVWNRFVELRGSVWNWWKLFW